MPRFYFESDNRKGRYTRPHILNALETSDVRVIVERINVQ